MCSSALNIFQGKTLVFGVSPNSLNHESFFPWSLSYQGPFGDALYQVVKAGEDSGVREYGSPYAMGNGNETGSGEVWGMLFQVLERGKDKEETRVGL